MKVALVLMLLAVSIGCCYCQPLSDQEEEPESLGRCYTKEDSCFGIWVAGYSRGDCCSRVKGKSFQPLGENEECKTCNEVYSHTYNIKALTV